MSFCSLARKLTCEGVVIAARHAHYYQIQVDCGFQLDDPNTITNIKTGRQSHRLADRQALN